MHGAIIEIRPLMNFRISHVAVGRPTGDMIHIVLEGIVNGEPPHDVYPRDALPVRQRDSATVELFVSIVLFFHLTTEQLLTVLRLGGKLQICVSISSQDRRRIDLNKRGHLIDEVR